jgi:hypothetical protein
MKERDEREKRRGEGSSWRKRRRGQIDWILRVVLTSSDSLHDRPSLALLLTLLVLLFVCSVGVQQREEHLLNEVGHS